MNQFYTYTNIALDLILIFCLVVLITYVTWNYIGDKIFEWRWERWTIKQVKQRQKQLLKNKS